MRLALESVAWLLRNLRASTCASWRHRSDGQISLNHWASGSRTCSWDPQKPEESPISSNLHPAAFDELMPKTLATATVDRLLHHAHVCQTTGESVRLSQALTGQGVSPLN